MNCIAFKGINVGRFLLQNESEILPFPNKPVDFQLNSSEFQDIFQKEYPRMHSTQGQIQVEEVKTKPEGNCYILSTFSQNMVEQIEGIGSDKGAKSDPIIIRMGLDLVIMC